MLRALLSLVLLTVASGCSLVQLRESRLRAALSHAGLEQRHVALGPDRIAYWEGGSGPDLLLLHGFGTSAIWQWSEQVEELAAHHRVIMPDLLWFGASRSTAPDFSLTHQRRALLALLQHLGVARVHLVGVSYGGILAYELASRHPDIAERVVLIASPGRSYRGEDLRRLEQRFAPRPLSELLLPREPEGVKELLALSYEDPPTLPGFVLRQLYESHYRPHRDEQLAMLRALLGQLRALPQGPRLSAPTLVVWGRNDPLFPLEVGKRTAAEIAGARLLVIDRARHAPNLEHAEVVNRAIVGFLTAHPPHLARATSWAAH